MQNIQDIRTITEKLQHLSTEARKTVGELIELLGEQQKPRKREKPKFEWAGCLKDYEPAKSSVEIQHDISKWRTEKL